MPADRALLSDATAHRADLVGIRRELHRCPELSGEERATMAMLSAELTRLGIAHRTGVGGYGVVGLIEGAQPGPCIGLRADMDALPVVEATGQPYASAKPGVMHACGHDAHMTCLLGAARLLLARREALAGSVKLIFQPSEERVSGARAMIDAGVLSEPEVTACIGFHVAPQLDVPRISFGHGARMAGTGTFEIHIVGQGGHAAQPHLCIDPIPVAAAVVLALQTIVSRRIGPLTPAVVTVGILEAGSKANIIAPEARLEGTYRFFDPTLAERIPELIRECAEGVARGMGAVARVVPEYGTPPLCVDAGLTDRVLAACRRTLGESHVALSEEQTMGGEDFAFIAERVPSAHFWLGARAAGEVESGSLHTPTFDVDEDALPVGAAALAACALELLEG